MRRVLPWAALAVVVGVALGIGLARDDGPRSDDERVRDIAASVRCPTCRGQSVLDSDAPVAEFIRADIGRRVEAGESDDEIRAYLVSRYGQSVLLTPPSSGLGALVWALPVVAVAGALAGLAVAFRRWRVHAGPVVADEDRVLVERARASRRQRP